MMPYVCMILALLCAAMGPAVVPGRAMGPPCQPLRLAAGPDGLARQTFYLPPRPGPGSDPDYWEGKIAIVPLQAATFVGADGSTGTLTRVEPLLLTYARDPVRVTASGPLLAYQCRDGARPTVVFVPLVRR